jgi:hypothetical protein
MSTPKQRPCVRSAGTDRGPSVIARMRESTRAGAGDLSTGPRFVYPRPLRLQGAIGNFSRALQPRIWPRRTRTLRLLPYRASGCMATPERKIKEMANPTEQRYGASADAKESGQKIYWVLNGRAWMQKKRTWMKSRIGRECEKRTWLPWAISASRLGAHPFLREMRRKERLMGVR